MSNVASHSNLESYMEFMVETIHSRWGEVKLKAVKELVGQQDGKDWYNWVFYYPTGEFMGSLDEEAGGCLGHPNPRVTDFMKYYKLDLVEYDHEAYCEMESIAVVAIRKHDSTFFLKELDEAHRTLLN